MRTPLNFLFLSSLFLAKASTPEDPFLPVCLLEDQPPEELVPTEIQTFSVLKNLVRDPMELSADQKTRKLKSYEERIEVGDKTVVNDFMLDKNLIGQERIWLEIDLMKKIIKEDNVPLLQQYLKFIPNPNFLVYKDVTILAAAAALTKGAYAVARLLFANGANPFSFTQIPEGSDYAQQTPYERNMLGREAFNIILEYQELTKTKKTLSVTTCIQDRNLYSSLSSKDTKMSDEIELLMSARYGNVASFQHLIKKVPDVNFIFKNKSFVAICVASNLPEEILLGVINHPSFLRSTLTDALLIEAAKVGNYRAISILLNEGLNVKFQDEDGNTALHYAVDLRYFPGIYTLLQAGANTGCKNKKGQSPCDIAAAASQYKIWLLLKNYPYYYLPVIIPSILAIYSGWYVLPKIKNQFNQKVVSYKNSQKDKTIKAYGELLTTPINRMLKEAGKTGELLGKVMHDQENYYFCIEFNNFVNNTHAIAIKNAIRDFYIKKTDKNLVLPCGLLLKIHLNALKQNSSLNLLFQSVEEALNPQPSPNLSRLAAIEEIKKPDNQKEKNSQSLITNNVAHSLELKLLEIKGGVSSFRKPRKQQTTNQQTKNQQKTSAIQEKLKNKNNAKKPSPQNESNLKDTSEEKAADNHIQPSQIISTITKTTTPATPAIIVAFVPPNFNQNTEQKNESQEPRWVSLEDMRKTEQLDDFAETLVNTAENMNFYLLQIEEMYSDVLFYALLSQFLKFISLLSNYIESLPLVLQNNVLSTDQISFLHILRNKICHKMIDKFPINLLIDCCYDIAAPLVRKLNNIYKDKETSLLSSSRLKRVDEIKSFHESSGTLNLKLYINIFKSLINESMQADLQATSSKNQSGVWFQFWRSQNINHDQDFLIAQKLCDRVKIYLAKIVMIKNQITNKEQPTLMEFNALQCMLAVCGELSYRASHCRYVNNKINSFIAQNHHWLTQRPADKINQRNKTENKCRLKIYTELLNLPKSSQDALNSFFDFCRNIMRNRVLNQWENNIRLRDDEEFQDNLTSSRTTEFKHLLEEIAKIENLNIMSVERTPLNGMDFAV